MECSTSFYRALSASTICRKHWKLYKPSCLRPAEHATGAMKEEQFKVPIMYEVSSIIIDGTLLPQLAIVPGRWLIDRLMACRLEAA